MTTSQDDPLEYREQAINVAAAASSDQFEADMRTVIERGLGSHPELGEAMRNLHRMLQNYFGDEDTALFFLGLLAFGQGEFEDGNSLDAIDDQTARARIDALVGRLRGIYGVDLKTGMDLTSSSPDDWQYISVDQVYNLEKASWWLEVELTKYNQQEVRIVGSPLSIMRLVNHLLTAINNVALAQEDYLGLLDEDAANTFFDVASAILNGMQEQIQSGAEAPAAAEAAAEPG